MKRSSFLWGLFAGLIIFAVGAFFIARLYSHPVALARKIAETDSVTATNRNEAFALIVTESDAKKIVRAIGTANRGPLFMKTECTPFLRLEFYKGTNFLAAVYSCGKVFWVGQTEYFDQTGALDALLNEYLHRRRERDSQELFLPTKNAVFFTNSP